MMRRRIYLQPPESALQRFRNGFWLLVGVFFLTIAIESLFITVPIAYRIFIHSRNSHVHTNRHFR